MFCECCNVTCYSQVDWNTHIQLIKHQEKDLQKQVEEGREEKEYKTK